jgi:hypothetical protein
MQVIHRLNSNQYQRIPLSLVGGAIDAQIELATPIDHFFQYLIDNVLIFPGPMCHGLSQFRAIPPQKTGGRGGVRSVGRIRKQPAQMLVV